MRESSRGFPDTEYAPSPYLLLGAGPVVGIDPGLPERLVPSAVQVGTSPEFALGLPQYDGRPDLFLLNRLGASQLVATLTEEDPFVWATFHGPSVVGYWPCGMALSPSGTHLYVLGHFDRGVRVLDVEQLRTTTQHHDLDALLTEHYLEPQLDYYGNGDNPTYQVTDTLSQLASSPNGGLLLAMLNEVGEVHLLGADPNDESALIDLGAASVAPAVGWLTAIDADYAEGPGRIQGVFGEQVVPWSGDVNSYEIEVWLFLKESNAQPATIERHVFSDTDGHLLTGSWLLDDFDQTNDDAEFPADSDYPNRLLFYSAVSSELFVGHTVWHYDPVTDELVFHRFLTADGTEPSGLNPLLAHRVLREDPDGALWAQRSISEGTPSEMHMEHVLALLRDDPGDGSGGYVVPVPEEELFKTPLVKSGWAERGGAFLFSRPHRPWIWRWDPP